MKYPGPNYIRPEMLTSTGSSKIHPLNARYLCSKFPHRMYEDAAGSKLELIVQPIAKTVVETHISHGGIIGIYYQTPFTQLVNTLLLSNSGDVSCINDYGYIDPCILDDDTLYMLLNPVEINGWNLHTPHEADSQEAMKDIGMNIPETCPQKISEALQFAIVQTQEKYRFLLHT